MTYARSLNDVCTFAESPRTLQVTGYKSGNLIASLQFRTTLPDIRFLPASGEEKKEKTPPLLLFPAPYSFSSRKE